MVDFVDLDGLPYGEAFDLCLNCIKVAMKFLEGSFPSQRIAFKDLISIHRNPIVQGGFVPASSTLGFDKPCWKMSTGLNKSYRLIYEIENNKPTNIRILHRDEAYPNK